MKTSVPRILAARKAEQKEGEKYEQSITRK